MREALQRLPQVLFLDIRMPGLDGLGAAAELADTWPADEAPMPQLVFVTAYDEYAARAFEAQAIDYVLKPVQPERLRKTVARLQQALAARMRPPRPAEPARAWSRRWRNGASCWPRRAQARAARRQRRRRSSSSPPARPAAPRVRMVPIDEVLYFEAADKYVRVLTADARIPDPHAAQAIAAATRRRRLLAGAPRRGRAQRRDRGGAPRREPASSTCSLRGRAEKIPVSRLYAHLFRAM